MSSNITITSARPLRGTSIIIIRISAKSTKNYIISRTILLTLIHCTYFQIFLSAKYFLLLVEINAFPIFTYFVQHASQKSHLILTDTGHITCYLPKNWLHLTNISPKNSLHTEFFFRYDNYGIKRLKM